MTTNTFSLKIQRTLALAGIAGTGIFLGGCSTVSPEALQNAEVRTRVQEDQFKIYASQEPVFAPITFKEALARSLKYNLDYRLKLSEQSLAQGLAEVANYDTLPNLLATAGYTSRNNVNGSQSFSINSGGGIVESSPPTYSGGQERSRTTMGLEFSWSILDFGVGYYRARQQANQVLIAEERRRRVVQNILSDVRSAYWRAVGAQRLARDVESLMVRVRSAIERSREAEAQGLMPPRDALGYQRQLLDAVSLLTARRQELEFAKRELAALMNVTPGTDFTVAEDAEPELFGVPVNIAELEELALINRPELRQEQYQVRVTADEARKQMLHFFPNLGLSAGLQYDSNKYLYNSNWAEANTRVSFNLFKLLSMGAVEKAQEAQVKTDDLRRMALSMAVLTQTRVAVERYRLALSELEVAQESNQVDQRLATFARAAFATKSDSELELIRAETRALNSAFQRSAAYATAQSAFGRIYNSIGLEVLPDDLQSDQLGEVGDRVLKTVAQQENETFVALVAPTSSLSAVNLEIVGLEDSDMRTAVTAMVTSALTRNRINVPAQAATKVLHMTLEQETAGSTVRRAHWNLSLTDSNGRELGRTRYSTTLPLQPGKSTMGAFAEAAVVSNLRNLRTWATTNKP